MKNCKDQAKAREDFEITNFHRTGEGCAQPGVNEEAAEEAADKVTRKDLEHGTENRRDFENKANNFYYLMLKLYDVVQL